MVQSRWKIYKNFSNIKMYAVTKILEVNHFLSLNIINDVIIAFQYFCKNLLVQSRFYKWDHKYFCKFSALSINHNMYINGVFLFYLLFDLHQLIILHCTASMEQYPLLVPVTLHYWQQVIEMSVESLPHLLLAVSSRVAGALTKYHRIFLPFWMKQKVVNCSITVKSHFWGWYSFH